MTESTTITTVDGFLRSGERRPSVRRDSPAGSAPGAGSIHHDATDSAGRVVGGLRMQLRWMTASSPLYEDNPSR